MSVEQFHKVETINYAGTRNKKMEHNGGAMILFFRCYEEKNH